MTIKSAATSIGDLPVLTALPVEHLADMTVELEPIHTVHTLVGDRMVFVAKGGRIEGPRISGELLPGGGDPMLVGTDGIGRVDAHSVIKTDDGVLIYYTGGGVSRYTADGYERLAAGEQIPFGETYIRTTPKFETADDRYTWLNGLVTVTYTMTSSNLVQSRIYAIL